VGQRPQYGDSLADAKPLNQCDYGRTEGLIMGAFTGLLHRLTVWEKGRIVPGCDPTQWRMDSLGSLMRFSEYGQTTTFGWEIDHIDPDKSDDLWNLQPLWCLNNRRKSDKSPSLAAALRILH